MIKATIIVITHNRPGHLRRLLDYYREYKNDFKIIVSDSSSDENKTKNKETISSFLDSDILYVNYHSDSSHGSNEAHHQLLDASNYVKSKYCIYCADDDFIAPKGIKQAVDFLENNPDFTVAHGDYVSFYLKTKRSRKKQFYWAPIYLHKSITFPEAKSRLVEYLSNYSVTIFGVLRTDFFKMIFKETLKFTNDGRFGELLPSMLALIHGKMESLDVLYGVREVTPDCATSRAKTMDDFIREGTYDEKYIKFRECLATHLSKKSQLGIEKSKRIVDKAMSVYINPYHFLIMGVANILHKLNMPDWIYKKISLLYRRLFSLPKKDNNYSNSTSTNDLPTEYYKDFNKIRTCIMSHAIKNNKMIKATIIIITHNRPGCLRRLIDYYREYKNDFKLIVSDSSSDENKTKNKEIISSFLDLDILYLNHYSEKLDKFRHQAADAVNYAKTKYCLFCADDDFVTPKGIKRAVDFLENNPDFTVVYGNHISFYLKTKKSGKKQFYLTSGCLTESITFEDPKLRLFKHLSDYSVVTLFGVHQTEFLKMIFKEMLKFTDDERFAELLPSMFALICGKMKCLDVLYTAREIIPDSAGIRNEDIPEFIKEGSYHEKYAKFKKCLAIHLSKKSQLDIEKSKKVIDDAMAIYLKKNYPNDFKCFLKNRIRDIFNFLNLPDSLYGKLRSLYIRTKIFFPKPKAQFLSSLNNPSSKYYDDFAEIKDCVISHANKR